MSVAFSSKSGDVEGDSRNLVAMENRSRYRLRSLSSVCWIGAAVVSIGFLLLTVILVAHNGSAINHWDAKFNNMILEINKGRDDLREERDQLKIHSSNLSLEMVALLSQYNAVVAGRDKLQEEVDRLNLNGTDVSASNHLDAKYNNMILEITKGRDDLREERDQLKIHSSNLSLEMVALLSQYNAVVASRDKLQEEVDRLNLNGTDKACHQGWKKLNDKCYYVSSSGVSKTWANSRKDCQERGADLVISKTQAVLDFIKRSDRVTWIGLSRSKENMWKWVDGTELEDGQFWQAGEPNNYDGEEDCVEVSRSNGAWNDAPCSRKFSWICET